MPEVLDNEEAEVAEEEDKKEEGEEEIKALVGLSFNQSKGEAGK